MFWSGLSHKVLLVGVGELFRKSVWEKRIFKLPITGEYRNNLVCCGSVIHYTFLHLKYRQYLSQLLKSRFNSEKQEEYSQKALKSEKAEQNIIKAG